MSDGQGDIVLSSPGPGQWLHILSLGHRGSPCFYIFFMIKIQSIYAMNKRRKFFENVLVPSMKEDVENGKYPEQCIYILNDGLHKLMEREAEKSWNSSQCSGAKEVLDFF